MGYGKGRGSTVKWCSLCYRGHHDECSGVRNLRKGGQNPSNRVPCECSACFPLIIKLK